MTELSLRLEGAERELAAIATAQEAQELADKAAAAAEFAKRAKLGTLAVNHATAIRILAERRMAELVDEGQAAGQIATRGGDTSKPRSPGVARLKEDLNIDDRRLAEARRLARDYTEADIREAAAQASADDKTLSRDRLLKSDAQRMQSSEHNEWYTPAEYIEAARTVLGAIDLDPASSEQANQTVQADKFYAADQDGLAYPWAGRLWLNPPYGGLAGRFVERLAGAYADGDVTAAVCLVSSHAVETGWFRPLWDHLLCFTYGRIAFISSDGRADAPTHGSVIAYLGKDWDAFAENFRTFGAIVSRWP